MFGAFAGELHPLKTCSICCGCGCFGNLLTALRHWHVHFLTAILGGSGRVPWNASLAQKLFRGRRSSVQTTPTVVDILHDYKQTSQELAHSNSTLTKPLVHFLLEHKGA